MKNLKKVSRNQMKEISGGIQPILIGCVNKCCPPPGERRCPRLMCPDVVCPQYV